MVEVVLTTGFDDLSDEQVHDLRRRLVDVVGCAVGGAVADGSGALRRVVGAGARQGRATVLGRGEALPPAEAAMLNAGQARAYDFEVSELHGGTGQERPTGHIPATVDLTALAVGEALGTGGREVIAAAAVAGDLAARLARAEDFAPSRSFDLSGTVTAFGAAAAAARLLGLDADGLRHALGLVLHLAAGSFQGVWDGVHAFRLPQAAAARNAVLAAEMASEGLTGPGDPLFSRRGYFAQYTRSHRPRVFAEGLGRTLHTRGYHKAYPSCYGNHPVIEACLRIAGDSPPAPDEVAAVEIELWADRMESFVAQPFGPGDSAQKALFNVRYAAATALVRGRALPADWDPPAVGDPGVLRVAEATRLAPTLPDDWGYGAAARVRVRLKGGRQRAAEVERPRGFPGRELDDQELSQKFRINVDHAGAVDGEAAREALGLLWRFDELGDVGAVTRLLRSIGPG